MRLIDGRDLQSVLAAGPLSPERAVRIVEQVAQALHAAHRVGLVHRDIKPSNILIDDNDFAYLIDFGIARAAGETGLTSTGATIGTWTYMAPERFQGDVADARADIYALACVLYESLTGQPPFVGDTLERVAVAHMTQPPPRPSARQHGVSARMDDVIATGMAKNPDHRYASTVELARAAREATTVPLGFSNQATQLPGTAPALSVPGPPHRATGSPAIGSRRRWLIALVVVVLVAAGGVVALLVRNVLSPKANAAELVLTGATDPGEKSFMPPAALPPPTNTQPPPTLQPHGNGPVVTQPLPGDRIGLYGGTLDNAACDREQMISFLGGHPAQAGAFVEALNTDPTLFWSGARLLTTDDIPTYLRELTPMLLRLDTRVTNHGFDGTHPTTLQSVLQAGTAVFADAHGVPRGRCYCGNPLTAPVALADPPKPVGTPWSGYNPAALAEVQPSKATITTFVLVDLVTGKPFNRPAGTTGTSDSPYNQPVPPPVPAPTTPTTGQRNQPGVAGVYQVHILARNCNPPIDTSSLVNDYTTTITQQGNTLTMGAYTGPLNADGSFTLTLSNGAATTRGVFATEGGRTVIRDGVIVDSAGICSAPFVATKQ
jgi:hypothetical protein